VNEFSAFRDSAAGQTRGVSPTYDYVQLTGVYFIPVFKFQHFGLFTVNAREVCPEGFHAGFHYDTRRRLCVEVDNIACLDIHGVSFSPCEYM
jgi:hypothetical protein